jgi:hypothetical protein
MSRKALFFGDGKFRCRLLRTPVSARLLYLALPLAIGLGVLPAPAEPRLREETRSVEVDAPFDVAFAQQSGTGTSWIVRDLAGVILTGQDVVSQATMPGGGRQIIFHLVAREVGDRSLEWDLIGASPGVVHEIFRLALHVTKHSQ